MDTIAGEPTPKYPCPFCADTRLFASQATLENGFSGPFQIECPCGAAGPKHDSLARAIDLWNVRAVKRLAKRG
jgi:hypothetical protein